jgi:hypothetical protein
MISLLQLLAVMQAALSARHHGHTPLASHVHEQLLPYGMCTSLASPSPSTSSHQHPTPSPLQLATTGRQAAVAFWSQVPHCTCRCCIQKASSRLQDANGLSAALQRARPCPTLVSGDTHCMQLTATGRASLLDLAPAAAAALQSVSSCDGEQRQLHSTDDCKQRNKLCVFHMSLCKMLWRVRSRGTRVRQQVNRAPQQSVGFLG